MPTLDPIQNVLGTKRAAHLLRRATFGATKAQIDEFAALEIGPALNKLLEDQPKPEPPIDPKTGKSWLPKPEEPTNSDDRGLFAAFKTWYLEQMRKSGANLKERMTYFYHTHLPADNELIMNTTSLYYQNALYRHYALGNFKKMFTKVTADNAMLVYIDNTLNDVDDPNENYAREMFELYSIGKGTQVADDANGDADYTNYTEHDVREAAKVLTGLKHNFNFDTKDPDTEIPRGYFKLDGKSAIRHNAGKKVFSARFNNTEIAPKTELMEGNYATEEGAWDEIDQLMDMIFAQEETARFICRKLYRFFVYYKITDEIEKDIIEPLAAVFRDNDYEIKPVLEKLLSSQLFFDDGAKGKGAVGSLIKSPIELTLGLFRTFEISLPTDDQKLYTETYPSLQEALELQGISFYNPIDVAGYPPYHQVPAYNRNWISPNSLAERYAFIPKIIEGKKNDKEEILYKLDVMTVANSVLSAPDDAAQVIQDLSDLLLTTALSTERFNYFHDDVLLDNQSATEWADEWKKYTSSNDDTAVRTQLESLFKEMLQSPEYQLF